MQQRSYPQQPTQPPYPPPSGASNTVRNVIIAIGVIIAVVILIWVFLTLIYPAALQSREGTLQVEIDCTNLLFQCQSVTLTGDVHWSGTVDAWTNKIVSFPQEWNGEECKSVTVTASGVSGGMTRTTTLCDGRTEKIVVSVSG
ncbi:MAG: hypothetical protein JSV43_03790 [Methanobacteriota archaeon]|nr:MAG: hypothetical protein JSV43_03790 [Euryarchaeota archaeon]